MVSSARQAVTCFLLIFSGVVYAHSQTTLPAKTSTASISGKVTIKGKAAAGIVVGVRQMNSNNNQSRNKAVTDDQGNYKIINIPPGQYQVVAVAPVYVSEDYGRGKTILINKDETVENVNIALERGGVITGKVTDSEGRPVIEEEVTLHPTERTRGFYYVPMSVRTDDRGIYRFYGLPPGKYRVGAGMSENFTGSRQRASYKLTYHPAAADVNQATVIDVTEGSEAGNVDITLGRTVAKYSAKGRIVDGQTGQPVPNVRYGLKYLIGEYGSGSTTTGAVSNSEGEFKLDNLSPGKYAVFFEPAPEDEFKADVVRFEVIDQDITGLIARTSKGATVSGVVVLEGTDDKTAQANFRNMRVFAGVLEDQRLAGEAQASVIEQDGSFRIRALKGGLLHFSVSNQGRFQIGRIERDGIVYPKGIQIKDGEHVSGVRISVNYGSGTVRGVFKIEGGALPQNAVTHVSLRRLGEDQDSLNSIAGAASPDARGQFFIEGVIPGTYEVTGSVYIIGTRSVFRSTKQQVVVSDGSVTNVTVTLNLEATPDRP